MFSPFRPRRFISRALAMTLVICGAGSFMSCGGDSGAAQGPRFQAVEPIFMSEGQSRLVPLRAGEEGQDVVFRLGEDAPGFASVQAADLVLKPGFDDAGKYDVEVLAAIGEGTTSSLVVVVNVADVNRPPTITPINPVTVNEGDESRIEIEVVDPDGDDFSLSLEGAVPAFATLDGEVLVLAPDFDSAGQYTLSLAATDARRVSSRVAIVVTVVDVDRPPVFLGDDEVQLLEGETLVVSIEAVDPDGDEATITLADGAPEWVVFDPVAEELELTPGFLDSGTHEVTLVAESSGLTTNWVLTITVIDVNRPPIFEEVEDVFVEAGQTEVLTLNAWDPDPEDATLLVTASNLPHWVELSGLHLFFSPPETVRGVFRVTVRISDRMGEYVERAFNVYVQSDSAEPILSEMSQREGGVDVQAGREVDSAPVIRAVIADPNGHSVRLQVEVRRADLAFTNVPTHHSVLIPGGEVNMPLGVLAAGPYKWQARVINSNDIHSDWVVFQGGVLAFRLKERELQGSLSVESHDGWTRHRTVQLTLQATSAPGASLREMAFSNDGQNFGMAMPWASSAVWTLGAGNVDDEHVIHAEVTDDLLNKGRFQAVVRVDETPPTGTFVIGDGEDYTTSQTVLLHATLDDAESGPYRVCFSNNPSGPWISCTETLEPVEWTLPSGDGEKTVHARLEDVARNASYLHSTVVLDAFPPSAQLLIDEGSVYTRSRDVTLQVEVSDSQGIRELCYAGENQSFGNCATPRWRPWTLPDADGVHTIRARAEDVAGNRTTATASIHLDRVAPMVSLAVPGAALRDGYFELEDDALMLSVEASDDGSGLAGVQFSEDGITWSPLEDPSMNRLWPTADSVVQISVRAVDNAGNVSEPQTALVRLLPDPSEPSDVPRFLINGGAEVTSERHVVLSFDVTALGGTDGYSVTVSNDGLLFSDPEPLAGVMEWELADGAAGERAVHARVSDARGFERLVSAEIEWDPHHANPSFVLVNDGATHTADRNLTLTYGSFPTISDVVDVCISDDEVTFTCGFALPAIPGSTANWELPDADGEYTVTAQFELADSTYLQATSSIILNRTAPVLDSVEINHGQQWTASRTVELWTSVTSVDEPVTLCAGEDPADLDCVPYANPSPFILSSTGGPHRDIHVRVGDAAGLLSPVVIASIGYDPEPPTITSARLQLGVPFISKLDDIALEVVASDGLSGVSALSWSHDDGASWTTPVAFSSPVSVTLPEGEDGIRTVRVRVFDKAGNVAETSTSILVDTTAPAVDLVLGNGSGWSRESQVDVTLSVSDAFGGDAYCLSNEEVELAPLSNCVPWVQQLARVHPDWALTEGDGVKQVFAYVRDQAGNVGMGMAEIEVRTTPPALTRVVLNEGAEFAASPELSVGVVVNEVNLSSLRVEFSSDQLHWTSPRPIQPPMTYTLPTNTNGERTVWARVTDPAGNQATASQTIILDTQAPVGQVRINGGDAVAPSSSVHLHLSWSDNVGVTHYCARNVGGSAPLASNPCWQPVESQVAHELQPGDGNRSVFVHFRDGAGNVSSAVSASIRVQTAPPELAGFDEEGTRARHRGVEVAWHPAVDTGKGVAGYRVGWSTNNQHFEWLPEQTHTAASIDNLPNGRSVFVRYRAYDDLGHFAESPSRELVPDWPFSFHHRLPAPTNLKAAASSGSITLAVGDSGVLLRSSTAGDVWRRMDAMVDVDLTGVDIRNNSRAAISTASGEVLLTRDGGFSWVATPVSSSPLHAVRWIGFDGSGDTWLAAGDDGLFAATLTAYDGTESWTPVSLPGGLQNASLHRIDRCTEGSCPSEDSAVAVVGVDGVLLRSTDGGETFAAVDTGGVTFRDLVWLDGSFHLISDHHVYELHGTTPTLSMSSSASAPFVLHGISGADSTLHVVGAALGAEEGRAARFLSDGTFVEEALPDGALPLVSAVSLDGSRLLALGNGGTVVRRFGEGWSSLSSGSTDSFEAIALSKNAAWVTGEAGQMLRIDRTTGQLTSASSTLSAAAGEDAGRWLGLSAVSDDELVLVSDSGLIVRTADGGTSFTEEGTDLPEPSFRAVSCVSSGDDSGCVAAGVSRSLAISLNDESLWKGTSSGSSTVFNDVVATGLVGSESTLALVGFAAGSDGSVWAFEGLGASATLVAPGEGMPLLGIDEGDGTLVTVGADGFIARSTNGGELWSSSLVPTGFTEDVLAVAFAGDGVWFATSNRGTVLRSVDNGLTWSPVVSGTRGRLSAIAADEKDVWAAGADGAILESDTAGE